MMTSNLTDIEEADRLSRKRARSFPAMGVMLIAQQGAFFAAQTSDRPVDAFKIGAWALLSVTILAALATGGFWLKPRRIRALMDDELTRQNRSDAMALGLTVCTLVGLAVYLTLPLSDLTARQSIHLIVSSGLVAGIVRFGRLERRTLA